jgi:membrane dipeptidase
MKRGYAGYKSFEYLDEDDYQHFGLAKELERVEPYQVPLTEEQEARAARIVNDNVVISLHEHPTLFPEKTDDIIPYTKQGRMATAFEGLAHSNIDAVFDNMMDGTCIMSSDAGWRWIDIVHDIGIRACDIAHQDFVIKTERLEDIYRAKREGKVAWIISLEASGMIENELDRLDVLYGLGARMTGITYSESNGLGSGIREPKDGGLTLFGRQAVERMNKIGFAIDVTHCGHQTSRDTIECSSKPVFITHTGALALWNRRGLKPDGLLKACADKGGVIGIGSPPHSTVTRDHPVHTIESVMDHFEYVKDLIGIDHVAFGPDTLYGDHVALHHAFAKSLSLSRTRLGDPIQQVAYVKGMENPTEAFHNIVRWLVKRGYSDEEIGKVIGGNIVRVLKEVWV